MRTRFKITAVLPILCCVLSLYSVQAATSTEMDRVLDQVVAQEAALVVSMTEYRPLVETYLQTLETKRDQGVVPVKDNYFFGRLDLTGASPEAPAEESQKDRKRKGKKNSQSLDLFEAFHSATFKPEAFARMLMVDRGAFDRDHYNFRFLRAEYLGEIRVLVFDVTPKDGKPLNRLKTGRFLGRIWVEDRDYKIVRFNGIYKAPMTISFHFDSWRLNVAPGLWLPSHVYTEESERAIKGRRLSHRGQIRLWGYDVDPNSDADSFTDVLIEAPRAEDTTNRAGTISPVESARAWEGEAEDNILRRLENSGFLAPAGPVDDVLKTVVTNLEVTNGLDIQPPVRCRILLTTPFESFTIGRTIVLSRGLLDVLPDESALAMVLSHELGHVLSGHKLDTKFAFGDRMLVDDRQALDQFLFERLPEEEAQADARAIELLKNSPYNDKMDGAGLFLKLLAAHSGDLPALIRPHFGHSSERPTSSMLMALLADAAPELDPMAIDQIAALPLGGRVKLDPWSARIELMNRPAPALLSAREKMPFQLTPLRPYLARWEQPSDENPSDSVARNEE